MDRRPSADLGLGRRILLSVVPTLALMTASGCGCPAGTMEPGCEEGVVRFVNATDDAIGMVFEDQEGDQRELYLGRRTSFSHRVGPEGCLTSDIEVWRAVPSEVDRQRLERTALQGVIEPGCAGDRLVWRGS
ncbi:hypothetical protein FTX61_14605 [Nitriliruptoraceae bacterium ZYF776]|nr:hypothetical protein [Profundirhabdus halotolerans]